MRTINVIKNDGQIVLVGYPDNYISMSISEAKKLSSDLHKALVDEWVKPDVKLLDAKQILADLDARRKQVVPESKQRTTKRSLQDDIDGL